MAFDLTGLWRSNDAGTYVIRQIGDIVWWLGLSKDNILFPELDTKDGVFYPGLRFCNEAYSKFSLKKYSPTAAR